MFPIVVFCDARGPILDCLIVVVGVWPRGVPGVMEGLRARLLELEGTVPMPGFVGFFFGGRLPSRLSRPAAGVAGAECEEG